MENTGIAFRIQNSFGTRLLETAMISCFERWPYFHPSNIFFLQKNFLKSKNSKDERRIAEWMNEDLYPHRISCLVQFSCFFLLCYGEKRNKAEVCLLPVFVLMGYVFETILILSITFFTIFWAFGYYFTDEYGGRLEESINSWNKLTIKTFTSYLLSSLETQPDTVKKNISAKFVQNLVHTVKMSHGEIVEHRDFENTKHFYENSRNERLKILQ